MAMNRTERMHVIGTGVAALLIAVVGWFLLISPQRDQTTDVQARTADAQLQNATRQGRIAQLGGEQKKWRTYTAALAAARAALPGKTDMSVFLRQLQATGAATNTSVSSVSIGDYQAVTPPAAPVAQAPTGGSTPAPSASPAPSATSGGSVSGLFQIPISATVSGSTSAMNNFLTRLQSSVPRAVLITEVTRGAGGDAGGTGGTGGTAATMQLKFTVFFAPSPTAGATTTPGGS